MTHPLIIELTKTVQEAVEIAKKVNDEKKAAQLREAEENLRKREEERVEATMRYIGNLPEKIKKQAEKGLNYVDIPIEKIHMEDKYNQYTGYIKQNTIPWYACRVLAEVEGVKVSVIDDKETDSGAYNEQLVYHNFYIRIIF